jgi:hypothetical protein
MYGYHGNGTDRSRALPPAKVSIHRTDARNRRAICFAKPAFTENTFLFKRKPPLSHSPHDSLQWPPQHSFPMSTMQRDSTALLSALTTKSRTVRKVPIARWLHPTDDVSNTCCGWILKHVEGPETAAAKEPQVSTVSCRR